MFNSVKSNQSKSVAENILSGFNKHYTMFQSFSAKSKELFEQSNWLGIQKAIANRIMMYSQRVNECVKIIKKEFLANIFNENIWENTKNIYINLLINHKQPELAETFFNSVVTKILNENYYKNQFIFVQPAIATEYIDSNIGIFKCFYPKNNKEKNLKNCFKNLIEHTDWKLSFADQKQDLNNILRVIKKKLKNDWPFSELNFHIEILHSPFYRNKCAYIFGKIINGYKYYPFALAILQNKNKQLYVDTALLDVDYISILFSFSRAYFLVDMDVPSGYVNFLQKMLPMRNKADFYAMIGLHKQSKAIFYREFIQHLKYSEDKFILPNGTKGLVMCVFTMASFPFVFKVIRDKFGLNKNFDQNHVIGKYSLVKKHDRVGRLADTLEFTNVAIPLKRIDKQLLNELNELVKSQIEIEKDNLILKHVYIERRLTPLNVLLKNANNELRKKLIIDYGNAIRELASANIFPGDMLFKNFGVTRYERVIFYDYDEIEYMTKCNFRKIPKALNHEYELSSEVWYQVNKYDVFPEEFSTFLLGEPDLKETFLKYHKDLLTVKFWQEKKERILNGIMEDFFPYPISEQFKLNKKQKGIL